LVVLWDQARAPRSFLSLNAQRNNPGRLIRSDELWPRLADWGHWFSTITGSPLLNGILIGAGLFWLARGVLCARSRIGQSRAVIHDWLIAGFGLAFVTWHWLIAFNPYDRYIHSLVPFAALLAVRALLAARMLSGWWQGDSVRRDLAVIVIAVVVVTCMIPPLVDTLHGDAAVGGDHGQHAGIDVLAGFLNERLGGEIVYDHWLNWELAYYLGNAPRVIVLYSPLPEALADDMVAQSSPRFFAVPSRRAARPWLAALRYQSITIEVVYTDSTAGFVVYKLTPPGSFSNPG
ncbi:MAG: hypothetical protein JW966_00980, partial [Anaerolineae bacterium]|nr:hypothetical protein [Anaerolineae bacterium]